jgi:hypothetical protein
MSLTDVQSTALNHLLRVAAAGVVALVIALVASPDVTNIVGSTDAGYLALVLTPILSALEKALTASLKN